MNIFTDSLHDMLVMTMVQRNIFCPITGAVLDVRTCGILFDSDGDPAYVCSPEAYAAIVATAPVREALAAKGLHVKE